MISLEKWRIVARQVIEMLEGGYYHPNMFNDGRLSPQYRAIYANSGETMYGLDRHAGHSLFYTSSRKSSDPVNNLQYIPGYTYRTPQAKEFWSAIDQANAKNNWAWNYKGGSLQSKLLDLAADIMYNVYNNYASTYLKPSTRQIVENDPALMINFAWAAWNGSGFFKFYADRLNTLVDAGTTNPEQLAADTISARLNSQFGTIRSGGAKIQSYLRTEKFKSLAQQYAAPLAGGLAMLALFFLAYRYIIKK